jgi:hypothetical protein
MPTVKWFDGTDFAAERWAHSADWLEGYLSVIREQSGVALNPDKDAIEAANKEADTRYNSITVARFSLEERSDRAIRDKSKEVDDLRTPPVLKLEMLLHDEEQVLSSKVYKTWKACRMATKKKLAAFFYVVSSQCVYMSMRLCAYAFRCVCVYVRIYRVPLTVIGSYLDVYQRY